MLDKTLGRLLPSSSNAAAHVVALTFLHELSSDATRPSPPVTARWSDLVQLPDALLGPGLDEACQACEAAWPHALAGFFDGVRFASAPTEQLRDAISCLERLDDRMGAHHRETRLGDFYQHTRSLSAKSWQAAYFTPWHIAYAMALINEPQPGEFIGDISGCGAGVFLIAALKAVRDRHGDRLANTVTLIGADIDPRTCQIARASLLLAGAHADQFHIACGNTLAQPIGGIDRADGEFKTLAFTCLLGNPPFGSKVARTDLEHAAAQGPLVIPDRVLYRPVLAAAPELANNGSRPVQRALAAADGRLFTDTDGELLAA